jgi:adenosylhomocysteinase
MSVKQITENLPYKVRNIELADSGRDALSISEKEMPGLMVTRSKYGPDKPLKGKKIDWLSPYDS